MRTTSRTALLMLISGLLGANLVASLSPSGRETGVGHGGQSIQLLPRASAQQGAPLESDLRTGKTLVTASPAGDTLFVWTCRVVNGQPSFESHRYTAGQ